MDILKQLSEDIFKGDQDDINSFFSHRRKQIETQLSPSLEARSVGGFIKSLANTLGIRKLGNYTPHYIKPVTPKENWLKTGEIVVESPITFRSPTVSTFLSQIDKSSDVLLNLEGVLRDFLTTLANYISDTSKFNNLSGIPEIISVKDVEIRSIDAIKRMVDLDSPSRTKLSRLFTSNTDLELATKLCNTVNHTMGRVDLVLLNSRVERIVELMEILENDLKEQPSKNSTLSLTKDVEKMAHALSNLAYLITAVDNVSLLIKEVNASL